MSPEAAASELRAELAQARETISHREAEIMRLRKEREGLTNDLNTSLAESTKLRAEIAERVQYQLDANERVDKAEAEIERLRAALAAKRPWSDEFSRQVIEGSQREQFRLEKVLDGWFVLRDKLREERDAALAEVTRLAAEVQALQVLALDRAIDKLEGQAAQLATPDLTDTGPYATKEDAEIAQRFGKSVEQLRSERALDPGTVDDRASEDQTCA